MRPEDQTPLKPRGLASAPKFLEDSQNKFLANEDENAYVQLEVFGDPAPKAQWFRGDIDLSEIGRFKFWTDGERSFVFMGIESCTKADEGVYRCIITNRFGKREHKFKLFISRSFKKGPPKREVPLYWSDIPRAKFIKQGSTDQVSFTSKLTVSDQSAKWFFKEIPCSNGDKYEVTQGGGAFTVVIKNPSPEDTGCYKCVLDNIKELFCETYLDVQPPDPEYNFLKPLPSVHPGYIGRPLRLSCLCAEDAQVSWFKDEDEINEEDEHLKTSSSEGEHVLEILAPDVKDSAKYSCKIIKFGKEGESETSSHVEITDFPHKFAKRLPESINLIERESLLLQTTTQETFATVKWLKDGHELAEGRKRNQRVKLLVREGLHCLAIDRCAPADQGVYTARTNKDETSCDVQITEFPHRFTKSLGDTVTVTEDSKIVFELEVEDEEADVTWLHDNIEFKPERSRLARIQIVSEGKKRCLTIKKCTLEDAAKITARTNADTTSTDLIVKCHNSFIERLCETAECSEHCTMEFFVQVKDTAAPVYFLLDKFPIEMEDGRFQQTDLGEGRHKLLITKVSKRDEGVLSCKTPTNRGDEIFESKCIFNVTEGESPPFIGKVEPVSCVAILHSYSDRMNSYIQKEACKLVIPYKIEGTRKSNLDILIEKEGQEVEIGSDIQMKVRSDRVVIDIMNPLRTNSGIYKVTISNDQGSCEIDVPVEVLDIPSPPLSVSVKEFTKDSVVVQWKAPEDDGGTPIKHFVTEILDFTTNNMWTSVAMSETGDCTEQLLEHLIEGHRYCFRVAAANRIGQSEPRETKGEIITKDPWDAPNPCGKAQIIDWTPTFADISWTGPTNDGGSPVTSFIIELKESSMRQWIEGTVIPIKDVEFEGDLYRGRCENLEEEYEYRFRVIAVNRAGKSNPGTTSEPVVAMHKNVSPYIKGEGLKDINMKEGKGLRFDLWVGGEPVPSIEWFRDDCRITNDDTTSINVYTKTSSAYTLKNAVLSIPKAMEDNHSGVYKLRLKNESGVFESAANVDIDGPPEKKAKKLAEQKAKEEQEQREKEENEKMEEALQNFVNRKLSDIKGDGKDEDKDSGLKIGEESCNVSEYESEYEYTDATEEDEDFYEDETPFDPAIQNNINSENSVKDTNKGQDTQSEIIAGDGGKSPETQTYKTVIESDEESVCGHGESDTNNNIDSIYNVDDSSSGVSCNSNPKSQQQSKSKEEIFQFPDATSNICRNDNVVEDKMSELSEQIEVADNLLQTELMQVNLESDVKEQIDETSISCVNDNLNEIGNANEQSESVNNSLRTGLMQDTFESNEIGAKTDSKNKIYQDAQNKLDENSMNNGANSSDVSNSQHFSKDHLEIAEHYVSDNEKIEDTLDPCDITEDNFNPYFENKDIGSPGMYVFDESEQFTEKHIEEPPEVIFNLEEHLANLQDQLDLKIMAAGFSRSKSVSEEKFFEGDKCLIALLDQMNRDDQDFKVWERDDYSFLRWYVTKQMETLQAKVDNLKFVEAIEGDVQSYIDRMSEDGVPLDRAFIQAAATIFNKDIILIPTEGETDFEVVVGGLSGPRGKGAPLYLGHIKKSENNSDIFVSVLPDQIDSSRISSILAGDLINTETKEDIESQEITVPDVEEVVNQDVENNAMPRNKGSRQWKRMDSYNGSASKELDHIIQDILNEDSFEELNKSLNKCEQESDTETYSQDNLITDASLGQYSCTDNVENASIEPNNVMDDLDTIEGYVGNVADKEQIVMEKQIEGLGSSIEHEEKHLDNEENVEVHDSSITEMTLLNEDTNNQKFVEEEDSSDGWTYDATTGYWLEDNAMVTENYSNDTTKNLHMFEDNHDINVFEESATTDQIDMSATPEPYNNKYQVHSHGEEEDNALSEAPVNDIIKESETPESDIPKLQESYMTEVDTIEGHTNEKEESCEGWTYDPNTGYWTEDDIGCKEENQINNDIILSKNNENGNDNITMDISVPLENLADNYISQFQDTQTICDPIANSTEEYITQEQEVKNVSESSKDINELINDLPENTYEGTEAIHYICDPLENLANNYITQFEEVGNELNSPPNEVEFNENKTETSHIEEENEDFTNISERLQNLANTHFSEISTYSSLGSNSEKTIACTEKEASSYSNDTAERNENQLSFQSEDIHSQEISPVIASNPEQSLSQEKKLVKRKIKIKVSVSEQDQVKECEVVQDCSPVAYPLSSSVPLNTQNTPQSAIILPDIMDCVSGENNTEISEIIEGSADIVNNTESEPKTEKDFIESDEHISKQNSCDIERSEAKRGPLKKYTKKMNKKPKEMLINSNQESEIKLEDSVTNCAKSVVSDPNICVVQTADGQTAEVKMRPPLRKYSKKKTASYRWSGTEMMQIEGPPDVTNNDSENIEIIKPDIDLLNATRANISYKKASAGLDKKLTKLGFTRSNKEFHKDGDNCLKALIDQMSQPGQDFKVWDKDDYPFLRWYIAKQLEIQISAGKAENYVKFSVDSPQTFVSNIQKDEEFINNDYLYSVAKIFNKDIVVIESSNPTQEVTYIKGGQNNLNGKGKPIFLGHLTKEDAGNDFYQSIVPNENVHIEQILSSLKENN